MQETIRPIGESVLVQPEEEPEKTLSGLIVVPRTVKQKEFRAKVLAVGPGRVTDSGVRIPPEVRAGDRVLVMEHNLATSVGSQAIGKGTRPPILVIERDILAVIEGSADASAT